ncbi:hypothetical protein PHMEG_00018596 [Phytophthora megakarya]|uniref:Reverse transcriptase n=1 Tax=Phytophthora megakarya TaxID=4795 RepID=A0A225VU13_9STRA|nr:hypothetical protein PHMEG_00018596 [Phytophthora megakarya]
MSLLPRLAEVNDNDKNSCLSSFPSIFGVVVPPLSAQVVNIDTYLATTLSDLAVRARLSLAAFAPSYELWNRIVRDCVPPKWTQSKPQTQRHRPKNHKSSKAHTTAVRRHVRKGQLEGRYLVLDDRVLELWPEMFVSLKGADDTRMINGYSYARGAAVNAFTDRENFPSIAYNPPRATSRLTIELPNEKVLLMLRDVSGAFRHVPVHADGSLAFYYLAATVINDIYEQAAIADDVFSIGQLRGNVWCGDHTCVVIDHGDRCSAANLTLRHAMTTVLGPTAINDKKFTAWRSQNKALGLQVPSDIWRLVQIRNTKLSLQKLVVLQRGCTCERRYDGVLPQYLCYGHSTTIPKILLLIDIQDFILIMVDEWNEEIPILRGNFEVTQGVFPPLLA